MAPPPDPEEVVRQFITQHHTEVFREAQGALKYPYLVPSGPYNQLWDWDCMFMGVALMDLGSAPYLAGGMKNFLELTVINDKGEGEVRGCQTPSGSSPTLFHAKPVIIQGAWLAAKRLQDFDQFRSFRAQMRALLTYWVNTRRDTATGLFVWYNQMESGADNLPLAPATATLTTSAPDLMVFLFREFKAYRLFLSAWGVPAADEDFVFAAHHMDGIKAALNTHLWDDEEGRYIAYNVHTHTRVTNRVFLMGWPLWEPALLPSAAHARRAAAAVLQPDMRSPFGIRSTSSLDPAYNNANIIVPYSNWQGPVWVVANACLCYGLQQAGMGEDARAVAASLVATLASDIGQHGMMHECYNADNGTALAAPNFMSWNTLARDLLSHLRSGHSPLTLE